MSSRKCLSVCIIFLLLAGGSSEAVGQFKRSPSSDIVSAAVLRSEAVDPPDDSVEVDRKSPGRALAYSLGGTVLLAPVLGTGLLVGPSMGHFYADNNRQAWIGFGIRGGATLVTGTGIALVWASTFPSPPDENDPRREYEPTLGDGAQRAGLVLAGVGMATGIGSIVYDIATAPGAAATFNRSNGLTARVVPSVSPDGEGGGLTLVMRF